MCCQSLYRYCCFCFRRKRRTNNELNEELIKSNSQILNNPIINANEDVNVIGIESINDNNNDEIDRNDDQIEFHSPKEPVRLELIDDITYNNQHGSRHSSVTSSEYNDKLTDLAPVNMEYFSGKKIRNKLEKLLVSNDNDDDFVNHATDIVLDPVDNEENRNSLPTYTDERKNSFSSKKSSGQRSTNESIITNYFNENLIHGYIPPTEGILGAIHVNKSPYIKFRNFSYISVQVWISEGKMIYYKGSAKVTTTGVGFSYEQVYLNRDSNSPISKYALLPFNDNQVSNKKQRWGSLRVKKSYYPAQICPIIGNHAYVTILSITNGKVAIKDENHIMYKFSKFNFTNEIQNKPSIYEYEIKPDEVL